MSEIARGKWPFCAPTKNNLDDAKIFPFNDPNVEHTTNKGIIQVKYPSILSPNVCSKNIKSQKIGSN